MRTDHWWVPLTGALFVIVLIVGAIVQGEPPGRRRRRAGVEAD